MDIEKWVDDQINQPEKHRAKMPKEMKVRISSIIFSVCLYLSFHFLLISILIGILINNLWNRYPYFIKGGVYGGYLAIMFILFAYLCIFFSYFSYDQYAGLGCIAFFAFGPAFISATLMDFIQPMFNYDWIYIEVYSVIYSIPLFIVIGIIIGQIIKISNHKKEPTV
ncbi:MAG: hypothetical protein A3B98_01995 [Candidatus Taylorbacteria bacterium RIFCSPHIGHO2_02_FULL_43_55]|nr:MAG: hypothetical protein A3B98_01995 [Candidatus Taylorbacteria bacterium RIFCSPHIGHO2_02_FULL_43_55]